MKLLFNYLIMSLLFMSVALAQDVPVDPSNKFLYIIAGLLALSEALAFIPAVKSNGIFQLIVSIMKKVVGK